MRYYMRVRITGNHMAHWIVWGRCFFIYLLLQSCIIALMDLVPVLYKGPGRVDN